MRDVDPEGRPTLGWQGLSPPYSTIVADPPWPYDEGWPAWGLKGPRRALPYSSMPVEDIAALPVVDLAAPGAHLFLWTTNRYLWAARDVALGWGFEPTQVLVWCKEPIGAAAPGGAFATATEFIVYGRRTIKMHRQVERAGVLIRQAREAAGLNRAELHRLVRGGTPTGIVHRWEDDDSLPNERDWERLQAILPSLAGVHRPVVEPPPPREANRVDRNWFKWPRGIHSEKPAAFLDVVEQASPGPYVELFARQPRLGWDSWGWGYEKAV
jgi:N6-adenosine-specific RNA methylase IME4